jgi:hypothetical protein
MQNLAANWGGFPRTAAYETACTGLRMGPSSRQNHAVSMPDILIEEFEDVSLPQSNRRVHEIMPVV